MTPTKVTSQIAATTTASKGKKIVDMGMSNDEFYLPNPEIVLEQVKEEHSSAATPLDRAANKLKSRLPPEGKLQLLAHLQRG